MSMYLPNPAVQPTGFEPGEFLDVPDPLPRDTGPETGDPGHEDPVDPTTDGSGPERRS